MTRTEIRPGLHYVGVNDRTKTLFEGLWPLPSGVSYNSYLLIDEQVALIDTVDACYTDTFLAKIAEILGERKVDYLIVNHMEPDHSASIAALRRAYPDVKIVGNAKTLPMIEGYYGITEGTVKVNEGDTLCIGKRTLVFYMIPMVHWPETMVTYSPEEQVVFSGDAFGTFGALDGGITDRELDTTRYWDEMYRYYANIVGKYGSPVQKALAKLSSLPVRTICSTHGPVWIDHTEKVIGLYDRMSRYDADPGVVIAYGSMYGNNARLAERIARELARKGVSQIVVYDLSRSHASYVLRDVFKYDTLIVGSPTYNGNLFPPVESLLRDLEHRCIPHRYFGCFGSFTWAGTAVRKLTEFVSAMGWELMGEPIEMKQGYTPEKGDACLPLVDAVAERLGKKS